MSLVPRVGRLYEELDSSCGALDELLLIYRAGYTSFTIMQKPDSVLLVKLQDVQIRIEPVELDV